MRTWLISTLALAVTAAAASADKSEKSEPSERVGLTQVLQAAIRRSPTLVMAHADHVEGKDKVDAADAIDDLHVIAKANGRDQVQPVALVGLSAPLSTQAIGGEVGIEKSLTTGGAVGVSVAASQVNYLYAGLNSMGMPVATGEQASGGTIASARLSASQPVIRGAGESVARAEQKVEKLTAKAQSAQGDDEAAGLVRDLAMAYWELVYATEAIAVDHESEQVAQRQIPITQEIVRAGLQPPSAIKIAELQVALKQEQTLRDETTRDDESLALRRLAGYEMSDKPLLPSDPIDLPDGDRAEADVVQNALAHGPGLAQKRLQQRAGDVAVDATNDGTRPRLDLQFSGEISGVAGNLGEAFGNISQGAMYTVVGGVSFQWDIGGSAKAAAAAARVHRVRLDAERADLDHQLESAAISATQTLGRAKKRVELSQVAVDVAADALKSELAAFSAGRSTNVLVFQRQDDVAQAKLRLARARVDAIEADVQIDYLTGGLLQRYGVSVIGPLGHAQTD